jgi:hypothetical protein
MFQYPVAYYAAYFVPSANGKLLKQLLAFPIDQSHSSIVTTPYAVTFTGH